MDPKQLQIIIDAVDRTKSAIQGATRGIGRLRTVQDAANRAMLAEQQRSNASLLNMQRMLFQHLLRNNMNHQAREVSEERRHQELMNQVLKSGLQRQVNQHRQAANQVRGFWAEVKAGMGGAFRNPNASLAQGAGRGGLGMGNISQYAMGSLIGNVLPSMVGGAFKAMGSIAGEVEGLVADFTQLGMSASMFKETNMVSLEALSGTREEAERLFRLFEQIDVQTPFSLEEVATAGKMLKAYGLDVDRYLGKIARAGAGSGIGMQQLIRLVERANAGIFDRRSFAASGITQEQLEQHDIKFVQGGKRLDPKYREQGHRHELMDATLKIMEERFGRVFDLAQGTAEVLLTTMDSNIKRVARSVQGELFGAWKHILTVVNDVLTAILGTNESVEKNKMGSKIREAIAVPFNLAARAIEDFLPRADGFLKWLSEVLDKQAISDFILKLVATVRSLGDAIANLFGLDLGFFSDSKNTKNAAQKFFDGIIDSIFRFLKWIFKAMQSVELFIIDMKHSFAEARNWITDTIEDIGDQWNLTMNMMAYKTKFTISTILDAFGDIADALSNTPFGSSFGGVGAALHGSAAGLQKGGFDDWKRASEVQQRILERTQHRRSRDTDLNMAYVGDVSHAKNRYDEFEKGANVYYWQMKRRYADRPDTAIAPPHGMTPFRSGNPAGAPPGTPGAYQELMDQFLQQHEVVKEWTDMWKEAYEGGRALLPEYLDAQNILIEALRRHAAGIEDSNLESAKAWEAYFDAVGDMKKALMKAQDDALGYLKKRTGNVESFFDLLPKGEAERAKRSVLPGYLQRQRDILANSIGTETDPMRRADQIGELLDVAKTYQNLFEDKSGFLSQFARGGATGGQDFALGSGPQAEMLRSLILNGDPNAERLLDPSERTADNTAAIRAMMERRDPAFSQNGGPMQPYTQSGPGYSQDGGAWNPLPDVTININGGDLNQVREVVLRTLKDAYRSSTGQSPNLRR